MTDKKYYWLKLKEDFFDDDTMEWVEEQPNGDKYELFYLKLCLKSLKSNGILIRSVGNMLVPYDTKKIAEITRTDIDTVRVAMELFKNIGLVQVLENGEIYLTQLQNMVGSESKWAKYKRKTPELENFQSNSNLVPKKLQAEKDIEIEKELELDIEKEKEKDNIIHKDKIKKSNSKISTEEEKQQVESIWKLYPKKKGKGNSIKKIEKLIKEYGYEQIVRCIDRYKKEIENKKTSEQYIQYGSTFFNSGYIDYLDKNYISSSENTAKVCFLEE